ncbi:MAG: hypothetical protein KAG97_05800, partial [Victivallales bacterium]|nr:hypothetical protein [Victivallales bacterium]
MRDYKNLTDTLNRRPVNTLLFSDDELKLIFEYRSHLPSNAQRVYTAELLCRCWLYGANSPEPYQSMLKDFVSSLALELTIEESALSIEKRSTGVKDFLKRLATCLDDKLITVVSTKIIAFAECDGIVPVVVPQLNAALPIPFKIESKSLYRQKKFTAYDRKVRRLDEWTKHLKNLLKIGVTPCDVVFQFISASEDRSPTGDSLGLSVALAIHRKIDKFSFHPLSVISTGAFNSIARLSTVDGLREKAKLAEKIGADIFFAPETSGSSDIHSFDFHCAIPVDSDWSEVVAVCA